MKRLYLFFIVFLFNLPAFSSLAVFSGKVFDASTKEPLAGATVSIPDLRITAITSENGEFLFKNLPDRGRFLIEIKYIGYNTITQSLDFSVKTPLTFYMEQSVIEAHEVIVTGTAISSDNRKNSTNVVPLKRDDLLRRSGTNLVDALSKTAAVSQVTTGPSVSKPVIRGLSYNRVVTLVDGARQEGQQWGDEHGIEADMFSTGRIEILRGPAALLYGSDAIGGVINILDPLSPVEGQIKGELLTNYATNNGLTGNSAMLEGNSNGFVWRGRASYKSAFAYNTPAGRIDNSAFNETNFSGLAGFNKKWGYAHIDFSSFNNQLGIPGHEHEEESGHEDHPADEFITHSRSRSVELPQQRVQHYKLALNSNVLLGENRLRSTIAYQNNRRREFEESESTPALFMDLKTYSYDFKYYSKPTAGWEPVLGVAGMFQDNANRAEEKLIPDYRASDIGIFAFLKKSWTKTSINFGARYNYRHIAGMATEEEDAVKFSEFKNNFSNLSGAVGFTYELNSHFSMKANAGKAFRAPNIAELSSNGVHEGTFRYEIGNTSLNPENSYYADISFEYDTDKLHAAVSAYNNYIDNYIYYRQLNGETTVVGSETLPVFRYVQDRANLYGMEAEFTYHPVELIHFDNSFSYTVGRNNSMNSPLPDIPAARLRNELRFEPEWTSAKWRNPYFSIELDNVFSQSRIDVFETASKSYSLVNLGLGTTFLMKKQPVQFNITVNNLFDKAYTNHLSRLRYVGILDRGRDVSFGIQVPIVFSR